MINLVGEGRKQNRNLSGNDSKQNWRVGFVVDCCVLLEDVGANRWRIRVALSLGFHQQFSIAQSRV